MSAYYNEIDPKAAAWLRELIKQGHIANGIVDERSIVELDPEELKQYTQCHFFAGIGVWSYALRQSGWPDDRPVWTGSCPCQPFSAAGKGDEFADERHLWPAWFRLIRECKPHVIFGEQVASKDALAWLDHVSTDLEAESYAVGAVDTCAAGFGAPHIRQRLYFVAESRCPRTWRDAGTTLGEEAGLRGAGDSDGKRCGDAPIAGGAVRKLADAEHPERRPVDGPGENERDGHDAGRAQAHGESGACGAVCGVADAIGGGCGERGQRGGLFAQVSGAGPDFTLPASKRGPTNGFWSNAEWIACRDGKARPTEPGTFPLVTGAAARVVRLRGYGNAINAEQARNFIEAFLEIAS